MYKIWLINHGWFATGSFDSLAEAIQACEAIGFECSIQKYDDGRFVAVASWSPIGGLRDTHQDRH